MTLNTELAKKLGFIDIFLFALGYIIGCGLFVLINKTTKYAKDFTWLAFLFAGAISILNVLSYMELSHVFNTNAGEHDYIASTMGKTVGLISIIILIFSYILTNTTVALSFGEYVNTIFGYNKLFIAVICILIFTFVNIIGVKTSSNINIIITVLEVAAILGIIFSGLFYILKNKTKNLASTPLTNPLTNFKNMNLSNITFATFIAMFAYSGFESTVRLIDEAKNPEEDIPLALGGAILCAIVLYTLISFVITRVSSIKEISGSAVPLADIAKKLMGNNAFNIYYIIGSISILSTILISTLGGSRLLHNMGKQYPQLEYLSYTDETTKTPILSILVIGLISILCLKINNVETAAVYTNYLFFGILALINISLIILHFNNDYKERLNASMLGGLNKHFPITPLLALIVNIWLMYFCFKYKIMD